MSPQLPICAWCFTLIGPADERWDDGQASYHSGCWREAEAQDAINDERKRAGWDPNPDAWDGVVDPEEEEHGEAT